MINWGLIADVEKAVDETVFYDKTVEVITIVNEGVDSDDYFETPKHVSSGIVTVPCYVEYGTFDGRRVFAGGMVSDGDLLIQTDKKWYDNFNAADTYVLYDDKEYIKTKVAMGDSQEQIIVSLSKRKDRS